MNDFHQKIADSLTPREYADLLNAAADLVEFEGWCQGAMVRDDQYCLLGAIRGSARRHNVVPAREPMQRAVARHLNVPVTDPIRLALWNDETGRQRDEVVAVLRDTAKKILNGDINPKE